MVQAGGSEFRILWCEIWVFLVLFWAGGTVSALVTLSAQRSEVRSNLKRLRGM